MTAVGRDAPVQRLADLRYDREPIRKYSCNGPKAHPKLPAMEPSWF
jgi:hypothetical protein